MKKRIFSLLLSVCMVLSMLPMSVLAAEGDVSSATPLSNEAAHSHCVCGGSINVGDHTSHSAAVTYTDMADSFTGGELAAGSYVLTKDITLTKSVAIAADAAVNLCLNGFKIDGNQGTYSVIWSGVGSPLNLCDCSAAKTGKITGAKHQEAIILFTGAVFNLYGGSITGNPGGGVYNDNGPFTMYGGSITGNSGDGVYNNNAGTFTMYGGSITGNISKSGGV